MNTCLVCSSEILVTGKRGRPSAYCSDSCRNHIAYERRKARAGSGFRPCSACAKPMQVTLTSAKVMTCLPCRQTAKQAREAERRQRRTQPHLRRCCGRACDRVFVAHKTSRRFCGSDCLRNEILANERVRDDSRRRNIAKARLPALTWRGDPETGDGLRQGPCARPADVQIRLHLDEQTYDVRCPECRHLTEHLDQYPETPQWGCHECYIKYVLLAEPSPYRPSPDRAASVLVIYTGHAG